MSSTSRHIREFQSDKRFSFNVIVAGTQKKRDTKTEEREKKTRKIKPAYTILHVQLHLLLRTRLALHLHLTHVARRPRRRREHFTLHLPLSLSLFFLLCVFIWSSNRVFFFPAVNTKIPQIDGEDLSFGSAHDREEILNWKIDCDEKSVQIRTWIKIVWENIFSQSFSSYKHTAST